jgi:hypothetical protein
MISAYIIEHDQVTHVGDADDDNNIHLGCRNTIEFVDSSSLMIASAKENTELCTIFFELTPTFINELKTLISVIEAHYD